MHERKAGHMTFTCISSVCSNAAVPLLPLLSSSKVGYPKPFPKHAPTKSAAVQPQIVADKPGKKKKRDQAKVGLDSLIACTTTTRLCCPCTRSHLLRAFVAASLLPLFSADAAELPSDPMAVLNQVHPLRPDWYEEYYALVMDRGMKSYEQEIAGYKSKIFHHLRRENQIVLELGVGTGPNFKYYASTPGTSVLGIDPNKHMEKYARAAAEAAGLPPKHFNFAQAVGEALPVEDASVDAVIGTLVLCTVKDVDMTLKEVKRVLKPGGLYIFIEHVAANGGTPIRFLQNLLDPLQQILSDGCHLTRETGNEISEAGFSDASVNMAVISSVQLIGPHVYGIAHR